MTFKPAEKIQKIKAELDHPVIDGDGHFIEYTPLVRDKIAESCGTELAKKFEQTVKSSQLLRGVPLESRRSAGISRTAWWGLPAKNTLDRATAMLPKLMYERLDEMGIDFALLYPTYGLTVTAMAEAELRCAMARAFNEAAAEIFAPYRDRLEPVAAIPMFTPEEACAELDYAITNLGLKAVMMAGVLPRAFEGLEDNRAARYISGLGHDSEYNYDPVWEKCEELGVVPTFHAGGQGWGTRISRSNYCYNHIGSFAAAGEATARSLFFGGVPLRFPNLRFAFLEGGIAWAASLHADIMGHFEKRNSHEISNYNPQNLDMKKLLELYENYAPQQLLDRLDEIPDALFMLSDPEEDLSAIDEFKESLIKDVSGITRIFSEQYFFGCEADDPMNALAFNKSFHPGNISLRAVFASDIGHWDVPDMKEVLIEAYELVEDESLSPEEFRAFAFQNAVDLWGKEFFNNTVIESSV